MSGFCGGHWRRSAAVAASGLTLAAAFAAPAVADPSDAAVGSAAIPDASTLVAQATATVDSVLQSTPIAVADPQPVAPVSPPAEPTQTATSAAETPAPPPPVQGISVELSVQVTAPVTLRYQDAQVQYQPAKTAGDPAGAPPAAQPAGVTAPAPSVRVNLSVTASVDTQGGAEPQLDDGNQGMTWTQEPADETPSEANETTQMPAQYHADATQYQPVNADATIQPTEDASPAAPGPKPAAIVEKPPARPAAQTAPKAQPAPAKPKLRPPTARAIPATSHRPAIPVPRSIVNVASPTPPARSVDASAIRPVEAPIRAAAHKARSAEHRPAPAAPETRPQPSPLSHGQLDHSVGGLAPAGGTDRGVGLLAILTLFLLFVVEAVRRVAGARSAPSAEPGDPPERPG